MSHLHHLLVLWLAHRPPHGANYYGWLAAHVGNGCGAIHSGNWSC